MTRRLPGRKAPWYAYLALLFPLGVTAAFALIVLSLFRPMPWDRVEITDLARYLQVNDDARAFLDQDRFAGVLPGKEALFQEGVKAEYRYVYDAVDRMENPVVLIRLKLTFDAEEAYRAELARTALPGARDARTETGALRLFDAEAALPRIAEKLDESRWLDGCQTDCAWAAFDDAARSAAYALARVSDIACAIDGDVLEDFRLLNDLMNAEE